MHGTSEASITWVPFLELYSTRDEHLRKVLKSFEVCWCDGVDLPTKATTVLDKVGRAIKCNSACAGVHHDLQIPVRRKNTKTAEYIAAQCCYGNVKGARPIAQDTPSQGQESTEGQNRSGHTQRAAPNEKQGQSGLSGLQSRPWEARQDQHRYSLMHCSEIIAQLECFHPMR